VLKIVFLKRKRKLHNTYIGGECDRIGLDRFRCLAISEREQQTNK